MFKLLCDCKEPLTTTHWLQSTCTSSVTADASEASRIQWAQRHVTEQCPVPNPVLCLPVQGRKPLLVTQGLCSWLESPCLSPGEEEHNNATVGLRWEMQLPKDAWDSGFSSLLSTDRHPAPAKGEHSAKNPSEGLRCTGNTRNEEGAKRPALRPRSAIIWRFGLMEKSMVWEVPLGLKPPSDRLLSTVLSQWPSSQTPSFLLDKIRLIVPSRGYRVSVQTPA